MKKGRFKRFVGRFLIKSVIASVMTGGKAPWQTDNTQHMNLVEPMGKTRHTVPELFDLLEPKQKRSYAMQTKPGWKSTEFWASIVTACVTVLNASGWLGSSVISPESAMQVVGGLIGAYAISRGIAKHGG